MVFCEKRAYSARIGIGCTQCSAMIDRKIPAPSTVEPLGSRNTECQWVTEKFGVSYLRVTNYGLRSYKEAWTSSTHRQNKVYFLLSVFSNQRPEYQTNAKSRSPNSQRPKRQNTNPIPRFLEPRILDSEIRISHSALHHSDGGKIVIFQFHLFRATPIYPLGIKLCPLPLRPAVGVGRCSLLTTLWVSRRREL